MNIKYLDLLTDAIKEALAQREAAKDLPCKVPYNIFDWTHQYDTKTFYHTIAKDNGWTVSVCTKCGGEHPLGVTFFAKIPLPLTFNKDEK